MAPITIPNTTVTVEAETLRRLLAEHDAPKPVEGQVYRWDQPDDSPFQRRWLGGNKIEFRTSPTADWHPDVHSYDDFCAWFRRGWLVPYTPPPLTFQVGEWVALNSLKGIGKVAEPVGANKDYPDCVGVMWHDRKHDLPNHYYPYQLRPATPEEIAAATRITPKVGMLLKRKSDGAVFRIFSRWGERDALTRLDRSDVPAVGLSYLSTEHYDILPTYTIQGVQP